MNKESFATGIVERKIIIFSYAIESKGYYCMPEVGDKVYQLLLLEQMDCLHESSEFYPDKTVKRFILDKEKVKGQEIFQAAGVDRMDVIVSLNIAESVLRRDVFGVQFQEICCR